MTNSTAYFFIVILLFAVTSVSCAYTPTDSLNKDSQKYLSFYESVDGERIHWEANFFDDEITSIYKNGKRIPDDLVSDYKAKVYDELDEMRFGSRKFSFQMPIIRGNDFNFDMDELQKELEELNKDLPKLDEQFKIYEFDSEDFKKEMEELKKELKENKSKIYKFKFDDEKFKEQMKEMKKHLKENLIKPEDFNYYFEWEEDTEA
jgi:peptidoglycan hydrolase CwlO-like protein